MLDSWRMLPRNTKRVLVCGLLAFSAILGSLWWGSTLKEEAKTGYDTVFTVSEDEVKNIESAVGEFVPQVTSFGLKDEAVKSGEDITAIRLVTPALNGKQPREGNLGDYFDSRSVAYKGALGMVAVGSPAYQATDDLTLDNTEYARFYSYRGTVNSIDVRKNGFNVAYNGSNVRAVQVAVSYNSHQSRIVVGSHGADWDGAYYKQVSDTNARMTLELIEVGGHWEIYKVSDVSPLSTFAGWSSVESNGVNNGDSWTNEETYYVK